MFRLISVVAAAGLLVAGLTACGGGSVSSGAGGGSGSRASSSLVVEVGSDRRVAAAHQGIHQEKTLGDVVAGLLVRNAIAQTAGVAIFVNDEQVAVTDEGGSAVIPLSAGTYEVCVLDPRIPENCMTVTVAPDSVVVVSDVDIDEQGNVTFGAITTESAEDNIAAFEDPNNSNKTIICHQTGAGQFTISVGTPAVVEGHLAHGDSLGPCEGDTDEDGNTQIGGPPDNVPGQGNNGNNDNRPDNAGPPESAGNDDNEDA